MIHSSFEIGRLFHTVRYLKAAQVRNRILRRLPQRVRRPEPWLRGQPGVWVEPIWHEPAGPVRPCRLREYLQHYQERPDEESMRRWMRANPVGQGPGWEPYPLSRRIVSWAKWMLSGRIAPRDLRESIAAQADYLSRRMEYHLLANHLFANAKALAFAGCLLLCDGWLGEARRILEREIAEQVLPDGGHFERSPMYHSLVLEDMLDLINLRRAYRGLLPDWSGVAARMLGWLQKMTHPDGQIAFFNDAAFGMAPAPAALGQYAARLGVEPECVTLGASGFVRLEGAGTVALFDAGPVGPDYQPGHAHAGTLSIEASHGGRRVLVNSGTSTYERGLLREWQRGTSAHNTVRVDGVDSSEVWAAHRVARRARTFDARSYNEHCAEAAHNGYSRLPEPVIHRRRVELDGGNVCIADTLEGQGQHTVEIFFHVHPEANVEFELDPKLAQTIEETSFYPQFDVCVPNRTVAGRYEGSTPVSFQCKVCLNERNA